MHYECVCVLLLTLDDLPGTGVIHLDLLGVGRQDSVKHVGLPLKQEVTGSRSLVKIKAGSPAPCLLSVPKATLLSCHSAFESCSDQRSRRVCVCVRV